MFPVCNAQTQKCIRRANRKRGLTSFILKGGSEKNVVISIEFYDHLTTFRCALRTQHPTALEPATRSLFIASYIFKVIVKCCVNVNETWLAQWALLDYKTNGTE